ncbi:hypothetical protein [Candidatus Methylocalor cossyra]|uniref:Crystall_3 domain-containing protein n=1 Tax=Candidatus Methylocalor cossyra TaxID=3108543 RepID=A0ABP1CBV6_9GAMM
MYSRSTALLLASALLAVSSPIALGKDCWVDVYDQADYQGEHRRIEGPVELPSLKRLGDQDWSNRIESLKVGADAEVIAYRKENFQEDATGPTNHPYEIQSWGGKDLPSYREQELNLGPGKKEHHLGDLNFHRNINSLKVKCRP